MIIGFLFFTGLILMIASVSVGLLIHNGRKSVYNSDEIFLWGCAAMIPVIIYLIILLKTYGTFT